MNRQEIVKQMVHGEFISCLWEDETGWVMMIMQMNGHAMCRAYGYSDDPKTIFLDSLYVNEEHRNRGYGEKLQLIREAIGKEFGCKKAMLWVYSGTWMEKWYRRRGYRRKGKPKDEHSIWMSKSLK